MNIGKLQIIIIGTGLLAALVAVLIFSGVLPGFSTFNSGAEKKITMWGTLDADLLADTLSDLNRPPNAINVTYQKKNPLSFESELIDALARQAGPDLVIFPSELILKYSDKLLAIPDVFMTERVFRDTFADGTDNLIMPSGQIIGVPFLIDPLVLFYNRDLFRNESIPAAPKTWNEFLSYSQKLTKINSTGAILQSGSALGVDTNIKSWKEIFSMMVLQTGAPIVDRSTLSVRFSPPGSDINTVENALGFYTDFVNPRKSSYSWSRSLAPSDEAFGRELLAMYFGLASENPQLKARNPHLNFDIAGVPQISGGKLNLTYGRFFSLGITRQSKNSAIGLEAISLLISPVEMSPASKKFFMAPSRRDLLGQAPGNPEFETIYKESVKSKNWLDIDYTKTSRILSQMIQFVYTGVKTKNEASSDAKLQLESLYDPIR